MRFTQILASRGFMGRSFDELARLSRIAFNLEAVKGPAGPRALYSFCDAESVQSCVAMSDDLIGGSSTTRFDFVTNSPSSSTDSPSTTDNSLNNSPSSSLSSSPSSSLSYARFHGYISTALPDDKPVIKRSGYAAFRTPDQPPTLLGRSVWDIDPYSFLALRIRSDGRSYLVNVQTEGVEPTDLHQHRLFAKSPGKWETVYVNWNDFVRTSYGFVVEPQTELLRQKVRSVGIGLTDRVEGPFELCIERIWATNDIEGNHVGAATNHVEGESGNLKTNLKNRKGERIKW